MVQTGQYGELCAVPLERKEGYARLDDLQAIDASITMGQSAFSATTRRFGITETAIRDRNVHTFQPHDQPRQGCPPEG